MTEFLRSWLLPLCGAAILCAFALTLTPEGRTRRVVRLLCGVVLIIALLGPLGQFDFETYSMSMASYRDMAAQAVARLEETNDRLARTIIEEECAAYVLDKARFVGLVPEEVSVTAKWGDALCWYPYEMEITVSADAGEKQLLAGAIEAELGIPEERQHWKTPAAPAAETGGG
ncbi:MAG: hypothetical protein E7444_05200 [Ruminococcaceae bacterium]|nr:hypothetical protein [Oscillospiraceae bacterium]